MLRVRFKANGRDYRPVNWPVKHPYWCTGKAVDNAHSIVVSYADDEQYIYANWPEASDLDVQECAEYTFTDRFPRPAWWGVDCSGDDLEGTVFDTSANGSVLHVQRSHIQTLVDKERAVMQFHNITLPNSVFEYDVKTHKFHAKMCKACVVDVDIQVPHVGVYYEVFMNFNNMDTQVLSGACCKYIVHLYEGDWFDVRIIPTVFIAQQLLTIETQPSSIVITTL